MDARAPGTPAERRRVRDFLDRPHSGSSRSDSLNEIGLWHCGEIVGAIQWQREADDSAVLWHPYVQLEDRELATNAMADLCIAVADEARAAGCRFVLTYIERSDWLLRRSLRLARFSWLTEFLCLNRPVAEDRLVLDPIPMLGTAVDYGAETRQQFEEMFVRTQCDGQDGAAFGNLRSPRQFFAILSSTSSPAKTGDWTLWRRGGEDIALLLLNEHWSGTSLEITYLGVIPEMGRQGLGESLIEAALARSRALGYRSLEANVDAGNTDARRLYDRLGFRPRSQHEVFIKRW